jgi:predicted  nucleic acid-binding Zn-ribbon protein
LPIVRGEVWVKEKEKDEKLDKIEKLLEKLNEKFDDIERKVDSVKHHVKGLAGRFRIGKW